MQNEVKSEWLTLKPHVSRRMERSLQGVTSILRTMKVVNGILWFHVINLRNWHVSQENKFSRMLSTWYQSCKISREIMWSPLDWGRRNKWWRSFGLVGASYCAIAIGSDEIDRWWRFWVHKSPPLNKYVSYVTHNWRWLVRFVVNHMVRKTRRYNMIKMWFIRFRLSI